MDYFKSWNYFRFQFKGGSTFRYIHMKFIYTRYRERPHRERNCGNNPRSRKSRNPKPETRNPKPETRNRTETPTRVKPRNRNSAGKTEPREPETRNLGTWNLLGTLNPEHAGTLEPEHTLPNTDTTTREDADGTDPPSFVDTNNDVGLSALRCHHLPHVVLSGVDEQIHLEGF